MFAVIKLKSLNNGEPTVVQGYSTANLSALAREKIEAVDYARNEFMRLNDGLTNGSVIVTLADIHKAMQIFYQQDGLLAEMLPDYKPTSDVGAVSLDATAMLVWVSRITHWYHIISDYNVDDLVSLDAIYASKWHYDARARFVYRLHDVDSTSIDKSLL